MHLEPAQQAPRPRRLDRRGGRAVRCRRGIVPWLPAVVLAGAFGAAGQVAEDAALRLPPPGPVDSERLYLSGTGPDDARGWEFRIDSGRRAGEWRVIPVPSNWELQGYGRYAHGKDWWRPAETALYRTRFRAPLRFLGRRVELVFEGVMTDAEVWLNGRPVGEAHRGGYTRFAYDVSTMLRYDRPKELLNLLEVRVSEASADASINQAEREADYWIFGGVYRPVYLEVHPASSITHLGVDARHDGRLAVEVESVGRVEAELRVQVETLEGEPVGDPLTAPVAAATTHLEGQIEGVAPWSAESPDLYRLRVELAEPGGEVLHRRRVRIGFRTVELRPGEGLFVNGRRVLLKGVNRHSHWPETGRAVPVAVNRRDVELIRSMNMNAVRTAHSPPDAEFLDACDELGLYVLDELPGWHDAYDTEVGARILREMVRRDVNHPSVILWANGNEGGWNPQLDPLFGELDPQRRPVLHPGARGLGFEASHYPDWEELGRMVDEVPSDEPLGDEAPGGETTGGEAPGDGSGAPPIVMPTEMLHALYDGGGGASLGDYWRRLRSSARLGGAFLWSLFDEGVVRTDRQGGIDTAGNRGADGLLGPHREPEASYLAVRELWSPIALAAVVFSPEAVRVELENRFDHTDLADCSLRWRWLGLPRSPGEGLDLVATAGGEEPLPAAAPGAGVTVELARPPPENPSDAVELTALGPDGRELMAWVRADAALETFAAAGRETAPAGEPRPRIERQGERLVLRAANGKWARFDLGRGTLEELGHGERRLELSGGARRADGRHASMREIEIQRTPGAVIVRARFEGALEEASWAFDGTGGLRLDYTLGGDEPGADYLGVGFDAPWERVVAMTWLGQGPYRVWRNRMAGARLGVWRTERNDTVTGVDWRYPEFPGYYAGVRWARLATRDGTLTLAPGRGLFLGLFTPRFPSDARTAIAEVPRGVTVLHRISAIGTKFHWPEVLGPAARSRPPPASRRGAVWLSFDGGPASRRRDAADYPL